MASVFNDGFAALDFPITDVTVLGANAGQEGGLYAALAARMLDQLPDPFGQLRGEPHRAIALDCLVQAVRAGILACDVLRDETILAVADEGVRVGRQTLDAVLVADDASSTRDAQMLAIMGQMQAQIAVLSGQSDVRDAGVPVEAIMILARRIAANVDDVDQALKELARAVEIAIEVQRDGARGHNGGELVDQVLAKIAQLSLRGEYQQAAQTADDAFASWQKGEAERQQSARGQGLAILDAGIKQAILLRDAVAVTRIVMQKAQLEHDDRKARFDALRDIRDEYYVRGRDKGLNFDLEIAITLARQGQAIAIGQDEIGMILNDLGNVLWALGGRESGTARLEEAVAAYRAALLEYTRDRVALDWAMTQNNLGNVLGTLGERESGTARLEEALAAYRAALLERTRDRAPLNWAMTQNNLGNALQTLGQLESGTARLEEAVAAYRDALMEYTRDRVPLNWAATQNNLGNVLGTLGQRESGTARLEEAVAAYRAALLEYTRDCVPLYWAGTQNNLGAALRALGQRESGTARLEEAVAAYRAALMERTRDRVALDWAMSTGNCANAQTIIAERTGDCTLAQGAVADLVVVIGVFEGAGHEGYLPFYRWALGEVSVIVKRVLVTIICLLTGVRWRGL